MKKQMINGFFVLVPVVIALIFSLPSCTDKFEEYNTDKTKLMEVGTKELAGLLSRAQFQGSNWLTTDNYNRMIKTITHHFSGQFTIVDLTYEQNQLRYSYHNSGFKGMYSYGAVPSLQCIVDLTKDDGSYQNEYAIALVWKVFLLHQVTDLWGPIPYTDAGTGKEYTTYESQKDVYYLMFDDMKTAIDILTASVASNPSANAFGVGDMIYDGNVQKWLKFANSLRLRLAIRISNIDPAKAKTEGEAAAGGVMLSETSDDAFLDPNKLKGTTTGNGFSRINPWYETVMSASMESFLKGFEDPRMSIYFDPVDGSLIPEAVHGYPELMANVGGFHGAPNGYRSIEEMAKGIVSPCYSRPNYTRWNADTKMTEPIPIMFSAETHFLKAEGAWRGWNVGGGSAQSHYEKGITVSMQQWGVASGAIQPYINSTKTPVGPEEYLYHRPPTTDIPVKFAANSEDQYEQIITQKWLANFMLTVEAFAEYRRTRLPKIYPKIFSSNTNIDLSRGMIVTRLPFTPDEYATQPDEVAKAIKLLGEGAQDLENVPLWWDVNPNGN